MSKSPLESLPRVDRVVEQPSLDGPRRRLGAIALTDLVRAAIQRARAAVLAGHACPSIDDVASEVLAAAESSLGQAVRPVVNASGVVLHTNLGRAPLGARAVAALASTAGRYASLEVDLATGRRGARGAFAESALASLTGTEAALVVNNCAAALLLALTAVAFGKAVIVSRGELVEIGGGFRIPEVLARSGARLVEVGTTNKTRLSDYAAALDATADVAAILSVHCGNFRQTGFVERPSLAELGALARQRGVVLVEDLGGGALVDLASYGLPGEPVARDVAAVSDLVCFSTDKALGGPQGGAIVGRKHLVEQARRDPLARALRLGRLPLVALEATLAAYLEGDLDAIAALATVRAPLDRVEARAAAWANALSAHGIAAEVVALDGEMGGGTLAGVPLSSAGIAISTEEPDAAAARLRKTSPPVLCRIHEGRLVFDARTVLADEDGALIDAIVTALAAP